MINNWISIHDEPMPQMKHVLICNEHQSGVGYIVHGNTTGLPNVVCSPSPWESPITHWQWLPNPPEV